MNQNAKARTSPLLAILFVTTSSSGSNLVWCWPPHPRAPIRLGRPRPLNWENEPDVSWRAAHDLDQTLNTLPPDARERAATSISDFARTCKHADYEWRRTGPNDPRVYSYQGGSGSRPSSGRASPSMESQSSEAPTFRDGDYGEVLGYDPTFLAEVLSPKRELCHQKFELFVDELAFIGHPVYVREDGGWGWDEVYASPTSANSQDRGDHRGRTKDRPNDLSLDPGSISLSPELPLIDPLSLRSPSPRKKRNTNALYSFHLVLVLDRPDPSSVSSSDLYQFVDVYYRQIAFKLTAALHHEQGRVDFVSQQALLVQSLKEACIARGSTVEYFINQALAISTLASAIRTVFTNISSNTIAYVTINEIPVQVQLPPNHIAYLIGEDEDVEELRAFDELHLDEAEYNDDDAQGRWLDEVHYGWKLPLLPWKAILLLDGDGTDPVESLWIGNSKSENLEDQGPKEMLRKFVGYASPTLSLSDIAALMDLDLQSEVYPMARLLVYNQKAKVIDVIPSSLKNVYVPPPSFKHQLSEYAAQFEKVFPRPVPSLPVLLATLSSSHQAFSGIVPSSDHRPMFTEVLIWLLQRDLLVMLHVRIRIVATAPIKQKVWAQRKREAEERRERRRRENQSSPEDFRDSRGSDSDEDEEDEEDENYNSAHPESPHDKDNSPGIDITFESSSPEVRRLNSTEQGQYERPGGHGGRGHWRTDSHDTMVSYQEGEEGESDTEDSEWEELSNMEDSIIANPAKATPTERRWLEAMKEGKDEMTKRLFEKLHIYFDGVKTTDEILSRTELSRRHLRDVLHEFDDYLITLLHA